MEFEFLKERYDFELERKEKLTDSLSLPVGILTGLGSLMGLMAGDFSNETPALTWPFAGLLGLAALNFIWCLFCLARVYHGDKYAYLPSLGELEQARRELREWYETVGEPNASDEDFQTSLRMRVIQAADQNAQTNYLRLAYLNRSAVALFLVMVFTALAGVPFMIDKRTRATPVPHVNIDNIRDLLR